MLKDLAFLEVGRVAVHSIPRRLANQAIESLTLSEVECQLEVGIKNYLAERIKESLGRAASEVVFDPDLDSPVPALIERCLASNDVNLVEVSSAMARHLYQCQTGVNNPGVLLVTLASLAGLTGV